MLNTGSRCQVLASSFIINGPRRGSLGFLSYIMHRNESLHTWMPNFFPSARKTLAMDATIYFHRYGFEKRHRCERRNVRALFPIYTNPIPINEISKGLKKAEKELPLCFRPRQKYSPYNKYDGTVIMTPYIKPCELGQDILLLRAYAASLLRNPQIFVDVGPGSPSMYRDLKCEKLIKAVTNPPIGFNGKSMIDLIVHRHHSTSREPELMHDLAQIKLLLAKDRSRFVELAMARHFKTRFIKNDTMDHPPGRNFAQLYMDLLSTNNFAAAKETMGLLRAEMSKSTGYALKNLMLNYRMAQGLDETTAFLKTLTS